MKRNKKLPAKMSNPKSSKKNENKDPSVDGFLEYQCYKHSNQIGAEFGGMNGPKGNGPLFEGT